MGVSSSFSSSSILTPRGCIYVGSHEQYNDVVKLYNECKPLVRNLEIIKQEKILQLCPILKPESAVHAVYEPDAMDIDVNEQHVSYLKGMKQHGGVVFTNQALLRGEYNGSLWHIETETRRASNSSNTNKFLAPVIINASGAWGDIVAAKCNIKPVGLVPKRRTIVQVPVTSASASSTSPSPSSLPYPFTCSVDEQWYFKPSGSQLLCSPADATPVSACNIYPDEYDIAVCMDRIQTHTTIKTNKITSSWAGLRSCVSDITPVIGYDNSKVPFFWLVGQYGYGIQTAPSASQIACSLLLHKGIPKNVADLGLNEKQLSPARLR